MGVRDAYRRLVKGRYEGEGITGGCVDVVGCKVEKLSGKVRGRGGVAEKEGRVYEFERLFMFVRFVFLGLGDAFETKIFL